MAFDPSIISAIPDMAPNPIQAKKDAYTLASQMNQNTLQRMQLKDAEIQHSDEAKAKEIVKNAKNDTPEDRMRTAEQLRTQVGPEYSNRFLKEAQGVESGDYALQLQKLQVQNEKIKLAMNEQEPLVSAIDSVVGQVYELQARGATPAMLDAKVRELGPVVMDQLSKSRPSLVPQIAQFAQSPNALTFDGWKAIEAQSKSGLERLKFHQEDIRSLLDQRKQATSEEQAETARRREEAYEKDVDSRTKAREQGAELLSPETLAVAVPVVMADPTRQRDYVPYGKAFTPRRDQLNDAIAEKLAEAGFKGQAGGNYLIQLRSMAKAEATSIGKMVQQNNNIESFERLARFNGDRLLELIDKLDNTSIPIIEGPKRFLEKKIGGSADAAEFSNVLNSFQKEAARILDNPNMTGVLTVSATEDLKHVISGDATAAQAKRVVNRIFLEMDMRKSSFALQIKDAQKNMTIPMSESSGPQLQPGSVQPATAPPAGATALNAPQAGSQPASKPSGEEDFSWGWSNR